MLVEWLTGTPEPTDYWLSTLPTDTPITELVGLTKICWRIENHHREPKHALGSTTSKAAPGGWHYHRTLVTATHLFLTTRA